MANPATPADVVNRWRSLTDQQTINAQTFLDDAWRDMRRKVPDVEARIVADATGDLAADVVEVLANAVLRVLKNPDGSKRESIDDGSWEPNQAAASGLLYLEDVELDKVRVAPEGYVGPAYVISLGG